MQATMLVLYSTTWKMLMLSHQLLGNAGVGSVSFQMKVISSHGIFRRVRAGL